MFYFMQTEYYSSLDGEPANRQAALTFALEAVQQLPSIPGVLNLAATIIADHHEADADADARLLLEGERLVRQAIARGGGTRRLLPLVLGAILLGVGLGLAGR